MFLFSSHEKLNYFKIYWKLIFTYVKIRIYAREEPSEIYVTLIISLI